MTSFTYPIDTPIPNDVMVDLETLGTTPGSAILSIGAVAFDPRHDRIGLDFHVVINLRSCRALGLREEPGTIDWWSKRSPAARALLQQAETGGRSLAEALDHFDNFIRAHGGGREARVWGNGAAFDNAMLADIYRRLGKPLPWANHNNRCFRTLKALRTVLEPEPQVVHYDALDLKPEHQGVLHNALDDALHQAQWALAIVRTMRAAIRTDAAGDRRSHDSAGAA